MSWSGKQYLERFPNPRGRPFLARGTNHEKGLRLCAKLQKRHDMVMAVLGEAYSPTPSKPN